jgi:hypothetical protein
VDLDGLVGYIESLPQPIGARIEGRIVRRGAPAESAGRSATIWESRRPTRLSCG